MSPQMLLVERMYALTGLVKTATRMFPKLYLDEVEFKELGDDVTLTSSV